MWYLPITDRLKRIYQSEQTAGKMRWHVEHTQTDGEMTHPSDARAWKHFNKVYPEFASNSRNVYLGLCTDGFSPFGMSGRQYSLWPVFLTPYNLPPEMCNLRELIFLTILIPGPNHPKRSLDVFLQPLIKELKDLWFTGVRTYDCSTKTNFTMRAMLLWTISDFPAYGILSGWTTNGRLACPYCNGTTDAFPSSISNLSQLFCLDLSHNELTGSFPLVRNLTKLNLLDLSYNHFSSTIMNPKSTIFTLHDLYYLNLGYNNFGFSTIPSEFGNLSRLESLSLSSTGLIGHVPSSFSNLSRLTTLFLDHNDLTSIISSQSHKQFEGQILEPISKLIALTSLDLSFLNLSYPIDLRVFSSFKSLVNLDLSGNSISLTSLSSDSGIPLNMEALFLSQCSISEFPSILKPLKNLRSVDVSINRIKGKIPEWLWSHPLLVSANFFNNSLNGFQGLPEVLVNSSLQFLDLSLNCFEGSLPSLPPFIVFFTARQNRFTGSIPLSTCNHNSLTLDLACNNFTGRVPPCLSNLTYVNLRKNNLEGSLPDMFHDGSTLESFDVGYNQLTGKLPKSLINCSFLRLLNVEHNGIKDAFPFWLKALPNLQVLTLRSNEFYGPISTHDDQGVFPELRIFEISDNNFTGSLPPNYFVNWKASSLQMNEGGSIYIDHEKQNFGNAYYIYADLVDLQYKGLSLEQVKVLTFYSAIDVSGNRFEGQIPESIGLLKTLIALNFSNNAFTGHIPSSLANVKALESLDLSRNQLSGTIPSGLKTLSFLECINVSHNQLQGEIPQGTQITGQPKSSYEGNARLCGLPLQETCASPCVASIQHVKQEDKEEGKILSWEAVTIGYALGVLFGVAIYQVIASYKPEWLVKTIGPYYHKSR